MESDSLKQKQQAKSPENIYLMVFGPSQFGKSTFVNSLLKKAGANCKRAETGDGSGESVTIKVKTYAMKSFKELFPNLIQGYDNIKIIDVPGLFDSQLRINDKELFDEIKKTLLESGVTSIDALLLFESVKDDARKVYITCEKVMELFGDSFRQSSILLTTKWDRLNKRETPRISNIIESMAVKMLIQTQKWLNDCEDNEIDEDQMNKQLSELGERIKNLIPYKVEGMDELLRERDELAKQIQERDLNRYVTEEQTIEVQEAEEYIEDEIVKVTEFIPLSQEEIQFKARNLYESQTPVPVPKLVKKSVEREKVDYIPVITTKFHNFKTGFVFRKKHSIPYNEIRIKEIKRMVTEQVNDIEYNLEKNCPQQFFVNMLQGEKKPITVDKVVPTKKVRTRPVMKKIEANHEKYDFEHYQQLAVNEIKERNRNSIRY